MVYANLVSVMRPFSFKIEGLLSWLCNVAVSVTQKLSTHVCPWRRTLVGSFCLDVGYLQVHFLNFPPHCFPISCDWIWHPSTLTPWNVSLAGKQLLKKLLITWTAARLRKVDMLAEKNGHIVSCFSASHQNIIGICFWLSPKKSHWYSKSEFRLERASCCWHK